MMIEPLDPNDSQLIHNYRTITLLEKINEIIDVINELGQVKTSTGKVAITAYEPQAEEALKQIAELQKTFDEHVHYARELQFATHIPNDNHVFTRSGQIRQINE